MRGATKMMLVRNAQSRNTGDNMQGNADMRNNTAEMRYDARSEMNYGRGNAEMRGYDRDRRGRFTGEMEMSAGRWFPPYYGEGNMEDRGARSEMRDYTRNEMEMEQRNPVGFAAHLDSPGKADASYQRMQEGNQMKGPSIQGGGAKSHGRKPKFDDRMASEWTLKMQNEDGTKGPHWTKSQVQDLMEERGLSGDPARWWVAVNMMYSDYCKIAKKLNVNVVDFCLELAKAFCQDKDAKAEDKLAAYYTHVVNGE